jgi:glutamate racemase
VLGGAKLQEAISGYIDPLIKENIDVLILGCTHFPLIENQIILKYSGDFKVISSAVETAKDVKSTLKKLGLQNEKTFTGRVPENKDCVCKGTERTYYETGNASKFLEVGRMFLGGEINEVVRVKLDMGQ